MADIPEHARNEMERSRKSLQAAQKLFQESLFEDCVSRAYYSVLHAAKAALFTAGVETDTHKGVRSMFGLHLVKEGLLEKEYAQILVAEQEDRELSDYDTAITISEDRAEHRVKEAEKFVARIEKYLEHRTDN